MLIDIHAVTNIPLLFICLILIIASAVLSMLKRDSKQWYIYLIALAVIETISIMYLAFL